MPVTRRSCCPTARSRASSAATARRTRCARRRWVRCRRTRACCCGCCPTATCTSPRRRAPASWSTRACPAARWRSSSCPQVPAPLVRICRRDPDRRRAGADCAVRWVTTCAATATSTTWRGTTAVVIASHGGPEAETIRAALDAGVGYIGLVASRVRGASILDGLDLTEPNGDGCTRRSAADRSEDPGRDRGVHRSPRSIRAVRVERRDRTRPQSHWRARRRRRHDTVTAMTDALFAGTSTRRDRALRRARLPARRRHRLGDLPGHHARPAAAAGGRARRRQDHRRENPCRRAGCTAAAAAVL